MIAANHPWAGHPAIRPVIVAHHLAGPARIRPPGVPVATVTGTLPIPAVTPAPAPGSDPDAIVVPIALVPQPDPDREPHAECEIRAAVAHRGFIDEGGIVLRDVNRVRRRRNDADVVAFQIHLLLRRVNQRAGGLRLGPELLHGFHHIGRLLRKGRAQGLGPLEVVVHPFHHVGIMGQRLDTRVPRLAVDATHRAVGRQIIRRERDIRGNGRSRQDQGDQRIGIKGDRPEHLVQLLGGVSRTRRLRPG